MSDEGIMFVCSRSKGNQSAKYAKGQAVWVDLKGAKLQGKVEGYITKHGILMYQVQVEKEITNWSNEKKLHTWTETVYASQLKRRVEG